MRVVEAAIGTPLPRRLVREGKEWDAAQCYTAEGGYSTTAGINATVPDGEPENGCLFFGFSVTRSADGGLSKQAHGTEGEICVAGLGWSPCEQQRNLKGKMRKGGGAEHGSKLPPEPRLEFAAANNDTYRRLQRSSKA